MVDSDSTRTEACVAIRLDPEAPPRPTFGRPRINSGHEQIIRLSREMGGGLKTLRLVSPSRLLSSTECTPGETPVRFPFSQEIFRSIPTQFPCDEVKLKLGNQTTSASKVRRVDFGGCGPLQQTSDG